MSTELNKRRIILIHGLASKPLKKDPHALWTKCIIENIGVNDPSLAKKLQQQKNVFRSAYWADSTPHHIADDA